MRDQAELSLETLIWTRAQHAAGGPRRPHDVPALRELPRQLMSGPSSPTMASEDLPRVTQRPQPVTYVADHENHRVQVFVAGHGDSALY